MAGAVGIWWIDTFTIRHGHYYRYHINGRNDLNGGAEISWSIPNLRGGGGRYAFALREVKCWR